VDARPRGPDRRRPRPGRYRHPLLRRRARVDRDLAGEADLERRIGLRPEIEGDAHRNQLDDLDEVPRRVVRWEERRGRPGGGADALDMPAAGAAPDGVDGYPAVVTAVAAGPLGLVELG